MDNHRAALWCWVQHLQKDEAINLFHIDRHWDALSSRIDQWVRSCPNLWALGIEEYLSYSDKRLKVPLFRYDNHVSIFLKIHGSKVEKTIFATYGEGDEPQHRRMQEAQPWELPGNLRYWLKDEKAPWICNIDLDYFVYRTGHKDGLHADMVLGNEDDLDDELTVEDVDEAEESGRQDFFSDAYYSELFTTIRKEMEAGRIKVLTLCLSPEFSGGWAPAEALCKKACDALGVNFSLPASRQELVADPFEGEYRR